MPHRTAVLIVDDDAVGAEAMAAALESLGYRTDWAIGADGALARLRVSPFGALVVDVFLPGAGGPEILRAARLLPGREALPAVVLTAAHDDDLPAVEADLAGLGPLAVLRKPAAPSEVAAAIESMRAAAPGPPA